MKTFHPVKLTLALVSLLTPVLFWACGPSSSLPEDKALMPSGKADGVDEEVVLLDKVAVISMVEGTLTAQGEATELSSLPFPGASALVQQLIAGAPEAESAAPCYLFSSQQSEAAPVQRWIAEHSFAPCVAGLSLEEEAITALLQNNPEEKFVLLGVSVELYQKLQATYAGQVLALLSVKQADASSAEEADAEPAEETTAGETDVDPEEAAEADAATGEDAPGQNPAHYQVDNFAQAAAILMGLGALSEDAALAVGKAAQEQGLAMSDGELETLLAQYRPAPAADEAIQETILMLSAKYKGVKFTHLKHAEEYAAGCDFCHGPVAMVIDDPENTKKLLHDNCKSCHAKGQPAEKIRSCKACHTEPKL